MIYIEKKYLAVIRLDPDPVFLDGRIWIRHFRKGRIRIRIRVNSTRICGPCALVNLDYAVRRVSDPDPKLLPTYLTIDSFKIF